MATVHLDTLTTLSAVEDRGAMVQMVREVLVTGLTTADFGVLPEALNTAGVPAIGSSPTGYANLVLVKRSPQLVPDSKTNVRVTLEYVSQREAGYAFRFSGGASLRQITTQTTANGNSLYVSHTYPGDDPDWPSETKSQGGECQVMLTDEDLRATGILAEDYPHRLVYRWTKCLNSTAWAGGAPYRWMCTGVTFEPHDMGATPPTWEFTFTFQYNDEPFGWRPRYTYIDPRTGRPPIDLVEGVGKKTLNWYPTGDFNTLFPF